MASSWPPKKNTAFDWYFFIYKNDGTVIAAPAGLTGRYVSANAASGGSTAAPVNVDSTGGTCRVSMTAAQMNSDYVTISATSTTTGAVPTTIVIYTAADTVDNNFDAVDTALTNLTSSVSAIPTAIQNADAFLARDLGSGSLAGTLNERTVRSALRVLRNYIDIAGGTMTVKKENDSDSAWTAAVTTNASAEPITRIDPT